MTEEIQYIGEHLWPGRIGQLAVLIAFSSAVLAMLAFYFATQRREMAEAVAWKRIGRWSFIVHGLAVFTIIGTIFYMMINQYYEYQYVQAHVSDDLPFRYMFSAFWEGQEGSFLLWMFWHAILGGLLMLSAKEWESPVMTVIASVEVVIVSMILGIYVGFGDDPMRIGSNPLLLLRDVMEAPIFANADYVSLLEGSGLNPLLQNYWMTIHPPTLFLGFASTVVPFAFAVAGLWTRNHRAWLKPALPWTLFSASILGTGILMGGAWAYEALSFGGYWAWDPVENMSLVPWLVLIAGLHTHLVARSTDHSIRSTYAFYLLTFILIVYSTFLTRSGVLGETSVHAFTEMGLEWQLVGFIAVYVLLSIYLLASRYRSVPSPEKEEATASKEFWLFIGSLVLLFSSVLITASTSLPVYNKICEFFDPGFVGRVITDVEPHYNKYQLWIGVFVALISGFAQFLRFRESNFSKQRNRFWLHTISCAGIAGILAFVSTLYINAQAWQYALLLFCGWFAVVTNIDYLIFFLRGNLKAAGSVFAHVGFGLMLVGILASGLNKTVISRNPFIMEGLTDNEDARRNTVLLVEGTPLPMGGYEVTLMGDTVENLTRTYLVNYKKRDENGRILEEFDLEPNILYDKTFTKVAASNPSTKHYLGRDVFTHIAALPPEEMDLTAKKAKEDSLNYQAFQLAPGSELIFFDTIPVKNPDTFRINQFTVELQSIDRQATHPDYIAEEGDLVMGATFNIRASDVDSTFKAHPLLVVRGQAMYSFPAQVDPINARIKLNEDIFSLLVTPEDLLDYEEFELAEGDVISINGYDVLFRGYDREPEHPAYVREEGDIPVGAVLEVADSEGNRYSSEPIFLVRGGQMLHIKDEIREIGIHARFVSLDPSTGKAKMFIAQRAPEEERAYFSVATDSYRTDWIALQAIEFPGINFFWIGSSLLMIGLTISMVYRIRNLYRESGQ